MHAVLLTLLVVTGADQPIAAPSGVAYAPEGSCPCEDCADDGYYTTSCLCDWFGPMRQTCYGSRFGCYPGAGRTMHRYPAFHGYYYRQPYNYRHYFDYPWHAAPHEPMGFFTYETPGTQSPTPADGQVPAEGYGPTPAPPSPPNAQSRTHSGTKPTQAQSRLYRRATRASYEVQLRRQASSPKLPD